MCNAWNHPPDCDCGWGGDTGGGGGGAPSFVTIGWDLWESFCRPTSCPHCGAVVFFLRHNGGSVWVDELGWPWPKHACFVDTWARRPVDYLANASRCNGSKAWLALVVRARELGADHVGILIRRSDSQYFRILLDGCTTSIAQ